ncbi:MAG: cytochrome C oxidase subunit IV family protein [Bacteroidales bacterium]
MENEETHIVPYRTFLLILALLIALTFTSLFITRIYLGALTAVAALIISVIKSSYVLRIFMHLKFDFRIFSFIVAAIALLIVAVITVTMLDYIYR